MTDGEFHAFLYGLALGVILLFVSSFIWDCNTYAISTVVGNGGAYYDANGEAHLIDHTKKEAGE